MRKTKRCTFNFRHNDRNISCAECASRSTEKDTKRTKYLPIREKEPATDKIKVISHKDKVPPNTRQHNSVTDLFCPRITFKNMRRASNGQKMKVISHNLSLWRISCTPCAVFSLRVAAGEREREGKELCKFGRSISPSLSLLPIL